MIEMNQDTLKLTPSQARTMRRAFVTDTITETSALYALENYSYFLHMGRKRPFLHNKQSGIVCPMCPEVAAQIELNFGIRQQECSPYWERQELRVMRYWRLIKKQRKAEKEKAQQPTPITTAPKTEQTKLDESILREYKAIYGGTEVLTKKFGTRTVIVVFPKLGQYKPRFREVWQLEDGKEPRQLKASYGNKSSIAVLEESGWKWGVLQDCCETLIRHLAGLPPTDKLQIAA